MHIPSLRGKRELARSNVTPGPISMAELTTTCPLLAKKSCLCREPVTCELWPFKKKRKIFTWSFRFIFCHHSFFFSCGIHDAHTPTPLTDTPGAPTGLSCISWVCVCVCVSFIDLVYWFCLTRICYPSLSFMERTAPPLCACIYLCIMNCVKCIYILTLWPYILM